MAAFLTDLNPVIDAIITRNTIYKVLINKLINKDRMLRRAAGQPGAGPALVSARQRFDCRSAEAP
jgi:hypothetical protein